MKDVKAADALAGSRGDSFMKQSVARGIQAAGENGGGDGIAFMGMGMNAAMNTMNAMGQSNNPNSYQPNFSQNQQAMNQQPMNQQPVNSQQAEQPPVDPTTKLIEMKKLLDAGVITEEEFKKIRFDLLGI